MSKFNKRTPVHVDFKLLPTDNVSGIPAGWVTLLREAEAGSTYDALAEKHAVAVGTVKSRIFRARSRIVAQRAAATAPGGAA